MQLFEGKKGLIIGVANDRSIAWGIANALHQQGAQIAFSFQPGPLESRVQKLANSINSPFVYQCDGASDASMEEFFQELGKKWDSFEFLVNGMAFANKEDLTDRYVDISRAGFLKALEISCYSFTKSVALSEKFMPNGGSCLALSYYGAEKWMPHYNIMGVAKSALESSVRYLAADLGPKNIRVNAISAGPIRTLAASGIGEFRYILDWCANNAPLRKNTTIDDVGKSAAYLLSDWGSNVTGEILHVDGGYHIVGMKNPDAPDINLSS